MPANHIKLIPELSEQDIARFWEHVDKRGPDECWPWLKGTSQDGYGRFKASRVEIRTHRISYFLHKGTVPAGLSILHHCDNPPCCNPFHVYAGTTLQNVNDRDNRGRNASGDRNGSRLYPERLVRGKQHWARRNPGVHQGIKNGRAKLTEADVRRIRAQHSKGAQYKDLSIEFGVTVPMIGYIIRGVCWTHVA